jgi:protein FRA10AC1
VVRFGDRFIRDDDTAETSYGVSVAKKYEDSLFKEYALIDLSHYKSGKVRLSPFTLGRSR